MSNTDLVRASRDGDQFHYHWAARQCLRLLSPTTSLKAISIEGPSLSETGIEAPITAGAEKIDVAEYYGSEKLEEATLIRYIQIKHSTVRTDDVWQPSELEETIKKFAERYSAIKQHLGITELAGKLELQFVSNRRINPNFLAAIRCTAEGSIGQYIANVEKLKKFTHLDGHELINFCRLLFLEGNHEGLWDQQNLLHQNISCYLVDADADAPLQLKELVTKKALSASADNPSITKMDVLRALKTDEDSLFPAECLIKDSKDAIPRDQENTLFKEIIEADGVPIIIYADGGVGKSVFATRIKSGLPAGSVCILYDCFGNGLYRNISQYRHRHMDALVQIANELAAIGLCHPLIPSVNADPSKYMKAFIYRLQQSIESLKSKNPSTMLCIIIDAADNAEMAAREVGNSHSFIRDLLREELPKDVRLVALCRTHRREYLNPPPDTLLLELKPFNKDETAKYLRRYFPDAIEQDIDEFHRLSSQNPRVQFMALTQKLPLNEILRSLGPNPTTVDDTIESLLDNAIKKLRDKAGAIEKEQIDKICTALAALRPFIPLSVLASISGVEAPAIRSFALDLGRPLLITEDMIQFYDEPAETWFRDRYKPKPEERASFITLLKKYANENSYASAVLPQLMFEAGQLDELISLALSAEALPMTKPVERRDIQLQRLQFALKASLCAKKYVEAAKLALTAGGETAGDERQGKLLQSNTDLAAAYLGSGGIQELISRKVFKSSWIGSHHAYESAMLSERPELIGEARSRLRITYDWLRNWSHLSDEDRRSEKMSDNDIAEMAVAAFNIHGADSCAREIRGWRPREVSFRVGRILARRFIDHERYNDLNNLTLAAGNNIFLIIAIIMELRDVHRIPPKAAVERTIRLALYQRINIADSWSSDYEGTLIRAISSLIEATYKLSIGTEKELILLLNRYLPKTPPRTFTSHFNKERFPMLRAYVLRAELSNQPLDVKDLAYDGLRNEIESSNTYSTSQDLREFNTLITSYLPWCQLWAATLLGRKTHKDIVKDISTLSVGLGKETYTYRETYDIKNEILRIWFDILLTDDATDITDFESLDQWICDPRNPMYTPTLIHIARLAARTDSIKARSLDYASRAFMQFKDEREDAETKSDTFVSIARAVKAVSFTESEAYFNKAVEVASKIGDENLDRWGALLDLADRAASKDKPNSLIAYRFARCAELTYQYVVRDKYFDWQSTVKAIAGLCASSSFAILSRWRDRNFGDYKRLLPAVISCLLERGDLNPFAALPFIPIRAEWDQIPILKHFLLADISKVQRETAIHFLYRYMILERQTSKTWYELKSIITSYGISIPDLDNQIAFCEHEDKSDKLYDNSYKTNNANDQEQNKKCDWDRIFTAIDLCNANDISKAYRKFRNSGPPYGWDYFFKEICRCVELGKEAEFIQAIANVNDFNLYHLRSFLEHFPEKWETQLSVKQALVETIKSFCRRFCMEIKRSRYYDTFPFKIVYRISGISEDEVNDVILSSIGETTEIIRTEHLFTLLGVLSTKLKTEEALEALTFGLDLFDSILEDDDGDGPWSCGLEPPLEIEASVAGYLWGCLASPVTSIRWEAAHVVRAICMLGNKEVLNHLINFANGAPAEAFYDSRLCFYKLHARQWFLIGLSRAVMDNPAIIAPYGNFLTDLVFSGEPHVLIRKFAKRTLWGLLDAGYLHSETNLRPRLKEVNISPFSTVLSERYQRKKSDEIEDDDSEENERYYYGLDMGPYWFAPLGLCFARSENSIQREITRIIKNDWGIKGGIRWDDDERHKRKIFDDMQTHHSHGSYPRVEDRHFYLCYHAMMVVAGELLASTPVYQDPDYDVNEFNEWLKEHSITRLDGRWLADRRDPVPLERPLWKDEKETDKWNRIIKKKSFDEVSGILSDHINLWGSWTWISGHRSESIYIRSALVSHERSLSLLRALQSAENHHDYRIPDADDDLQIEFDDYLLKGWIIDRYSESGIDEKDPWAGGISYPLPEPAAFITDLMNLSTDDEHRRWFIIDTEKEVAWTQVWGHFKEAEDNNGRYESGERIQVLFEFILELLRKLRQNLIIKVEITRSLHHDRWERGKDYDVEHGQPKTRLYLIRSSGEINTL